MRKQFIWGVAICILLAGVFVQPELLAENKKDDSAWQTLFNGKDLKDWDIVIGQRGPTRVNEDPDNIFQVHDGMVHAYKDTEGKTKVQYGYFLTKKKYSHYHLRFEFKWGKKKFQPRLKVPRDAGVLYHVVGEKKVWPRSLELQIEEKGVGDFLTVYGAQARTTVDPESIDKPRKGNARFREAADGGVPFVSGGPKVYWVYRYPEAAKEGWNTMELIVRGSESAVHKVNGTVVNRVTDLRQLDKDGKTWIPLKEGKILFQAEAAEVYYRNIEIKELPVAGETKREKAGEDRSTAWRGKAVDYARIMSRVKWSPVADGMPKRGGHFEKGKEYTGVPYSSVKSEGRYIGFDIFLKTFLAAVENPHSVLYTENLYGKVTNAECYYGKVCSSYTSYALQCGIWYVSRAHGPSSRDGVTMVESQSAQAAKAGDIIFTHPSKKFGGSHIEMVTEVTRDKDGRVTHVRVEESSPQTTKNTNRSAKAFTAHIGSRGKELYRITDLDAWRGGNKAEDFLFPNYKEDSATPTINRVLLLDRGDWVPYYKGQDVKFNIMDRDNQGVRALVIKRGDEIVEEIKQPGKGVVERTFSTCGFYTAHCVMKDGSLSQACEFSVCDLDASSSAKTVSRDESWEINFKSENMKVIIAYLKSNLNGNDEHNLYVTDQDRRNGRIVVPANLIQNTGKLQVWLFGENQYGRLKKRLDIIVKE